MHDLVVLSDLHLGRGLDPESGHYHRLETFFYDEDFKRFCKFLCREAEERKKGLKVILNGDIFDLLRVDPEDTEGGNGGSPREKRYGPTLTPAVATRTLSRIIAGHPVFMEGLAILVTAGHDVIFMPGNHDSEMQWDPLQDEVRRAVMEAVRAKEGDAGVAAAQPHLQFKPWFHYEPGRIWIEHGCQYDPENAFKYPLRAGMVGKPDEVFHAEQDMPFGNFIQRYLYNMFGNITFIVPSTRANARYLKWLLVNEPRLLLHVVASHVPFVLQLLRRMARAGVSQRQELVEVHARELTTLAESSGMGEQLIAIDKLKYVGADVVRAAGEIIRQAVRLAVAAVLVTMIGAGLWALGSQAINDLKLGIAPKAVLSVIFNFFAFSLVLGSGLYWLLRVPQSEEPWPLRRAARKIAALLDVPLITFGHTHDEVITRLARPGGKGWYFNTGTWIAVFTHDVLLPRDRIQFTFLRVRDQQGVLLHWSPGRNEPMPVILLDEDAPDAPWRVLPDAQGPKT
ncbi:MAG: metallophosphoesterase [Myxococcaceae bacterium]